MNSPVYQTVIIGGGFTGIFTALHLAHEHYPRSVILIDKEERFCFKPLQVLEQKAHEHVSDSGTHMRPLGVG